MDIFHAANISPAEHLHPTGPETFYIIEGDYEFFLNGESIMAKEGDVVCVSTETPHRFVTGDKGGHAIVVSPPNLEFYFWEISKLMSTRNVRFEEESKIGEKYGQVFLDGAKHWK